MNRLFKPLLITIAFLICTGTAWGQDFMIGDSTGTTADFCIPCSNELWGLFDTNATVVLAYTASAGDEVTSINCHCSTATSVNVPIALYTYNTTTDSLMVKVGEDSESPMWTCRLRNLRQP